MVRAARAIVDEPIVFVGANLVLVLAVVIIATLMTVVPAAIVLVPLLALPGSAILRLASVALADGVPTLGAAWTEAWRGAGRKLLVAAVQLLLTGLGILNLLISAGLGGLAGALSGIAVAYGMLAVWGVATPLWSLLSNPRRDAPVRRQLRLAAAVVLARPLGILVLLAVAVGSAILSIQLFFPALLLPSFVLLAVAAYVGEVLDRLDPLPQAAPYSDVEDEGLEGSDRGSLE
jgi:hypothetical protein